jgi:hypothetical protein
MTLKKASLTTIIAASSIFSAAANSAYTPAAGSFELGLGYEYKVGEKFWLGETKLDLGDALGFDDLTYQVASMTFSYGITDTFAFDLSGGYTWSEFDGGPDDNGFIDTKVGLRYAFLNENDGAPIQAAVKVAGILAGNYEEGQLASPGLGENGFESSLLLGKRFADYGGFYSELGYRYFDGNVPDAFFGTAGLYANLGPVTVSAGYRHTESRDGGDIGGPGFGTAFNFSEVKKVNQSIEASIGFSDSGGRYYQAYYSRDLDGRNVVQANTFGVAITFPFGGGEPDPVSTGSAPISTGK